MNLPWIALIGTSLLWTSSGSARGTTSPGTPPAQPQDAVAAPQKPEQAVLDPVACAEALRDTDLIARERFFDELVLRADVDPQVEVTLRSWIQDAASLELAWTARLALREIEQRQQRSLRAERRREEPFAGLGLRVQGMPPGTRALLPRGGASGSTEAPGDRSSTRTFRVEAGPKAVRIEMRDRSAQGEEVVQEFEAPDMAQLLEKHPEIARDLGRVWFVPEATEGVQGPLADRLEALQAMGASPTEMRFSFDALWGGDVGMLRTDILGIQVHEFTAGSLFLDDGNAPSGVLVERIVPGTIAEALSLRRGDVLLELNGTVLRSGEDVTRIVKERSASAPLVVRFVRDRGEQTLTWRPCLSGDPEACLPAEQGSAAGPRVPGTAAAPDAAAEEEASSASGHTDD